jgi:hypothetical protein
MGDIKLTATIVLSDFNKINLIVDLIYSVTGRVCFGVPKLIVATVT